MSTLTTTGDEMRYAEEIAIGTELPATEHRPSYVQLFRYCAVTWNSHRIHFDPDYAASEGYPDVLVQSHLHGAFLTHLCAQWAGRTGTLKRLAYSVRRFACPGDVLRCEGTVVSRQDGPDGVTFSLELREVRESDNVTCALGDAEVFFPLRGSAAGSDE